MAKMTAKEKVTAFSKRFKLDSHHTMERSGLFMATIAVIGVVVLVASGFSANLNGRDEFNARAVWTTSFTTSKSEQSGQVDGVYSNESGNRVLILMHFDERAKMSYDADDYRAWLLGSDEKQNTEGVLTPGITSSFQIFGSTGYMGVLLTADQPFAQQVLNLTMRAGSELTAEDPGMGGGDTSEVTEGDVTFRKYDQWRIFINPGATEATHLSALDDAQIDTAKIYYETVAKTDEVAAKDALDAKLQQMRGNLNQITSYTDDMATTKVDGLFLRPPKVPTFADGDVVDGETVGESDQGRSTLKLETEHVVPGGFNINWRAGNVYDGYLDAVIPDGESYVTYLSKKAEESNDPESSSGVNDMDWILSDGSNLAQDYQASDVTMRPLVNVMNNLSQAYQDYYTNKSSYQSDLMLDLLRIDVALRDVQSNSSVSSDDKFLVTYYE